MAESRKRAPRSAGTGEEAVAPSRVAHNGGTDGGAEPAAKRGPVNCDVAFCPVCLFLTAVGSAQPDVMEHLLAAGRELMVAMKTVLDARTEGWGRRSPLEKIVIE